MSLHSWLLFVFAVFLLSGTPGPNMLHILSRSVELGMRRSTAAMAGCLLALLTILIASAAGLTGLLLALPGLFTALRYAGVAYLVFLGVKAWRSDVAPLDPTSDNVPVAASPAAVFRGGYAVGISNPKAILFAAAFLPQFVEPAQPEPPQFAILVATFAVIETGWYVAYALGGRSLSRHLARPAIRRWFNRVTGTIFIGFGLALLRAEVRA
jgi:threonine/homoserine/homoserine lactone efflux protein